MQARAILSSVAVAVLVAATLVACSAPRPKAGLMIEPEFEAAFQALEAAVVDHEDELARRILDRIAARQPTGDTLKQWNAFRRVLDGRELGRSLDLRLSAHEIKGGRWRVRLHARYPGLDPLYVTSGPGSLQLLLTGVDIAGFEQRRASSSAVLETASFEIQPGVETRIRLGDFRLPTGAALAVRATWELSLVPGEVVRGTRRGVPVNEFVVQQAQVVRLASHLPTDPVEPAELVRYLEGDAFSMPAMLERAVRIPSDRRDEALELLGPVVERMTMIELERTIPALRWLSGNRDLGGDPALWRTAMAAHIERRERERAELEQNNDLLLPTTGGS